jgi:hypothetical protein
VRWPLVRPCAPVRCALPVVVHNFHTKCLVSTNVRDSQVVKACAWLIAHFRKKAEVRFLLPAFFFFFLVLIYPCTPESTYTTLSSPPHPCSLVYIRMSETAETADTADTVDTVDTVDAPRGYLRLDTLRHPVSFAHWHVEEKVLKPVEGGLWLGDWGKGGMIIASTMEFVLTGSLYVGKIAFPAGRHLFPCMGMFSSLTYLFADNNPGNEFRMLKAIAPEGDVEDYVGAARACLCFGYGHVIATAVPAGCSESVSVSEGEGEHTDDAKVLVEQAGVLGWKKVTTACCTPVFRRPLLARDVLPDLKCLEVRSMALDTLVDSPAFKAFLVSKWVYKPTRPPRGFCQVKAEDINTVVELMRELLGDDEEGVYAVRDVLSPAQTVSEGPELRAARDTWRQPFDTTVVNIHDITNGNLVFVPMPLSPTCDSFV